MPRVRGIAVLILALLSLAAPPARAALMSFDSLPGNSDQYSSYTENGITLFAQNGPPNHFHDDFNFVNFTTGASIFSDDGTPQRIVFNNGADLFSLLSIDVWTIDTLSGPVTFTSSSGAMELITAAGTVSFGAGFSDVSFVRIDVPGGASSLQFGIDNIQVTSNTMVPEPSSCLVLLGVFCSSLLFVRRRTPGAPNPWVVRP